MQVRIQGTANLTQAKAEFAALQAQVAGLNAEMAASAKMPVVNPAGYKKLASAVDAGSEAFRNSLASTGAFRVEQMRLNSATQHYTDLLQKQKLTFRDLRKNADIMKAAYKEQLAMQETMVVRQAHTGTGGKGVWDVASAKAYSAELDTMGKRMNWLGAQWKSAGTQMVNFGKNTQWAGRQLTVGFTMPMAAVGVAAGVMAYQINKQMTRIKKVYDTTADQSNTTLAGMAAVHKEFAKLESDAWNTASMAAAKYGASATDTLGVQAELAATGQKGAKLQAATTEVMKSAMLGEIDYQTATKATIAIQQQLHLSSTQLADSWAYMNSVENSTSLQMKDFASAIPIALGPIKQMGGDLQDLGTLMTAMISRGVAVGKAANAIKALPQRLSRPSKQVAAEFQQLTGQDIVELNRKNPNNIIGLLTDIENATKNLSTLSRRKALAGLFGSFQLSNMSAMLQGMDDLQKGIGQTTKAQQIGEQSTQQWAQVSSQEIKQFQQSASGQFKIMVENLKIEVAKMGDPFLKIASTIGKAVTKIISAFNDLPSAAKILIAIPLMLAAIAGPALMLVGLFYNLRGNAVRLAGSILSMGKALVIATEEERAMTKAHQQEQEVMASSAGQIKTQTFLLEMLAKANTNAEKATMAFALAQAGVNPDHINAALGREVAVTDALTKSEMALSEVYALEAKRLEELAIVEEAAILRRGGAATAAQREQLARTQSSAVVYKGMSAAELEKETAATAKSSEVIATNSGKAGKGMKIAGAGAGVFAAGMAASMLTSNKVVQNIAQFAMTGALLGPMFTSLAGVIGVSAGLLGVIGIAVAAIGFGGYKLWQYEKKRQETLDAQNKALGSQKNLMADLLHITPRKPLGMAIPNVADVAGQPGVDQLVTAFQTQKAGKDLVGRYQGAQGNTEKDIVVTEKYIQILQSVGGNAQAAQRYLTAMFIAAGDTTDTATQKAQEYRDKIGEVATSSSKIKLWGDIIDTSFKHGRAADTQRDLDTAGKDIAEEIGRHTLDSANNIMDGVSKIISNRWAEVWTKVDKPTKERFAKLGVDSAEAFQKAMADVHSKDPQGSLKVDFGMNSTQAQSFMTDPAVLGQKTSKSMKEAMQSEAAIVKYLQKTLGLSKDINTLDAIRATWEFKLLGANKANAESLVKQSVAQKVFLNNALMGIGYTSVLSDKQKTAAANQVLAAAHMGQAKTYAEALAIAAGKTADNTGDAANKAGDLKKNLNGLDKLIHISYDFSKVQVQSVRKSGMTGVMDDMADAASTTFDNRMNASLDASQKMWDNRIAANDAKAQKASTRLDNKWERIHAASDAKWERRKDAMTKFYDKRIDAVDAAIKAEQDAEDIRQKIFEAEKTRLERLSEMANKNIDFNVAVNTGNLDEAAKIRNDIAAQQADWNLSDASAAGSTASQKRIDRMNNSKDALGKQKDAALAQLEKNEKAANASLDRREKKEKAHLEKITKMQATALKNQSEAAMAANKKRWDNDKATFDKQMVLFKSYIARNKKDLDGWMKQVGLSYDDFGGKLKTKGDTWSSWFQKSWSSHVRAAGKEIQSDNMWTQMGKQSLAKMLSGMGFKGMGEFRKFIKTGNLPANFGTRDLTPPKANTAGSKGSVGLSGTGPHISPTNRHTGGLIDSNKGSRKGVARSLKSQHSSEVLLNAQKGEYVVNRDAVKRHGPLIDAINNGKVKADSPRNIGNGTGGESPTTVAAIAAGGMAKMMAAGLMASMQKTFSAKVAATGVAGGTYGAGKAGTYGDASFSAEQLKNAATIASVGSRSGMTARDIEIALITAITEAGLMNLDHGDRDSLGIFQQRSSWGSVASRMNVAQSAQRFFNALKGVADRNSMSPGQAAQAVQRSAFPERYQTHWDEAVAIYKTGLTKGKNGGFTAASGGTGGWHRASVPGKGWVNSHDYRNGKMSPLYAYNDGRIVESRELPPSAGSGQDPHAWPRGFGSYGVTVVVQGNDGAKVRYAHMYPGSEAPKGPVKGGALIGRSAATGNATGPHTHFEVNGQEIAREWFQAHGIGLSSGGYTTSDGMANLHKDEVVISPNKTNDLYKSLDTFTSFMDSVKNVGSGTGGEPLNATPTSGISRLFSVGLASVGRAAGQAGGAGGSSGGSVIGTGSGPKGTVRSGTLNAHTYGHKPAKTIADLKKVLPTVDSLALQEWTNAAGAAQKWLIKQGWGIFRGPTGTAIAWNKAKYTESHSGSKDLNKGKLPHGISQRYAVYGLLRNKKTGQKFWQASVHLLPNEKYKGYGGKLSHARRQALLGEEYQNVSSLVDRLDNSAPVVLGGDFNNQSLRKIKGLKGFNPGHIDHIYTSGSKGNTSVMSTKGLATDHPYVYGNYALPGLSTGGYTMSDGMAMLHKKELVVDAPTTKMLHDNLQNVASGSNDVYNIHMKFEGDVNNKTELKRFVLNTVAEASARKPQSRRG